MTTPYRDHHDDPEDDTSSFWNKERPPVLLTRVSRYRWWVCPVLTTVVLFTLTVTVVATNSRTWTRLWFVEEKLSNLNKSLINIKQLTSESNHNIQRLKFVVENNKEQLNSMTDVVQQVSSLDSIRTLVESLSCSIQHIINNGSVGDGCCPLNWESFGSGSGLMCFLFSKDSQSWSRARDQCNGLGAHLAILHSDKDWDFVTHHSSGAFYWIGLTDQRTGNWEWVNQTPYVMNRRRWRPGQPDSWTGHGLGHGDEDCAHLHSDGRLNDLHCSTPLRYVCQRHAH